ncbi:MULTISPECIES: YtpR family tRNA-binding protein [unclassified Facklamia]|uniref:YtpR family tRNA-binding protein n=1 Tax=Aerococcaceae TaxID=186827 RepID=UPI0013BB487A|nr:MULTISPECIES: DUF4479 family protein [unclassified Facklamia]NEW64183.1 DUF4479 domain-containing protein [Facklamia sp. 252]NEW68270.1 DUF4479 domain-containing protein [Facklamia sp. 253]QQD65887.1 DUF4479 domain-containing protein [Aerococcaceae bacterium zg-252]
MWLAFYNQEGIGDVLLLTSGTVADEHIETKSNDNVTVIYDEITKQPVSINIFGVAETLGLTGNGAIELHDEQVKSVNQLIQKAGFDIEISVDNSPKFVVGHVETCVPHEDSDHLSVTTIRVAADEVLQIVCGARNIAKGLKVLVALPGAVMPSGLIIWPGELRGVVSNGMVCSTRELELTHIEDYPGIWELKSDLPIGMPLSEVVAQYA